MGKAVWLRKGDKPDKIHHELQQAELTGKRGGFEIREGATETKLRISPSQIYSPAFPLWLLSFIEGSMPRSAFLQL